MLKSDWSEGVLTVLGCIVLIVIRYHFNFNNLRRTSSHTADALRNRISKEQCVELLIRWRTGVECLFNVYRRSLRRLSCNAVNVTFSGTGKSPEQRSLQFLINMKRSFLTSCVYCCGMVQYKRNKTFLDVLPLENNQIIINQHCLGFGKYFIVLI